MIARAWKPDLHGEGMATCNDDYRAHARQEGDVEESVISGPLQTSNQGEYTSGSPISRVQTLGSKWNKIVFFMHVRSP